MCFKMPKKTCFLTTDIYIEKHDAYRYDMLIYMQYVYMYTAYTFTKHISHHFLNWSLTFHAFLMYKDQRSDRELSPWPALQIPGAQPAFVAGFQLANGSAHGGKVRKT